MQSTDDQLKEITRLENTLMTDLNDFNNKYACYLRNPATNPSENAKKIMYPCTTNVSRSDVDAAKNNVDTDITNLRSALREYGYSGATNQAQYLAKYNNIFEQYNKVIETRKDLDAKLAELYGTTNGGISNYYNNKYSATMFSKLMLTILLTSLAYYTFMKIIEK